MALLPSNVTPNQVYAIIEHEDFSVFHRLMKKELGIEDIDYRFATGELAEGEDGYFDIRTNARTKFLESWEGVEKITFLGEGLSHNVNLKFSKLPREAFLAAVEICIKFALVHELVHVRQFKAGVLTKQKMKELQQVPYEKRDIEIEANTIAKEILNRYGKYNAKVLEILTSNESIDNINLAEISRLFEEQ
ncbi:hypothetical protein [Cohnella boryungensis]|uniref:Uncharacterized protein n=1 Tax=Cohnella boryungensis TaxID=768479 RepID=A0ABV8S9D4_9BACL